MFSSSIGRTKFLAKKVVTYAIFCGKNVLNKYFSIKFVQNSMSAVLYCS